MKRNYIFPAIFHPEETGFSVFFPDIKGCHTQGENIEEATLMAQEALGICLDCFIEDQKNIPIPSSPNSIQCENNEFVAMICVDVFKYRNKLDGKAVKKTLTIPSWLNKEAEKQHINFSSVLQEALLERIGS